MSASKYVAVNLILALLALEMGRLMAPAGKANGGAPSRESHTSNAPVATGPISREFTDPEDPRLSGKNARAPAPLEQSLYAMGGRLASAHDYDKMMQLLLTLAAIDPNAAIDYALQHLKAPFQEKALSAVLGVWAKADPQSAFNWVRTSKSADTFLADAVLNDAAGAHPDMAWAFATQLGGANPDEAAGYYVSAMNGMISAGNYVDAARLLGSAVLPAKAQQSEYGLAGLLAGEWAEYEPDQAAAWVLTLPEGGNARRQAVIALGQSWANTDPQQAVNFATQLAPSPERMSMLTTAVSAWLSSNPAQANAWISTVATGPGYDQFAAAISVAPQMVNSNPEGSVTWAMDISDNALKMDSLTTIFAEWFQHADVPAMAYLTQMPPDIQDELFKRLNFRRP